MDKKLEKILEDVQYVYKPMGGVVDELIRNAALAADHLGKRVHFEANDTTLLIDPNSDVEKLITKRNKATAEYEQDKREGRKATWVDTFFSEPKSSGVGRG